MNNTKLIDYYKYLFQKVSFDYNLLGKEYKKSLRYLNPEDQDKLEKWMIENYPEILNSSGFNNYKSKYY